MAEGFIPPHGGYASLLSYRKAEIIYDATVYSCHRFFEKRDRTCDQMVQAARSGKQNIAEGSQASGTSKETELKLTNVARSSLEEQLSSRPAASSLGEGVPQEWRPPRAHDPRPPHRAGQATQRKAESLSMGRSCPFYLLCISSFRPVM